MLQVGATGIGEEDEEEEEEEEYMGSETRASKIYTVYLNHLCTRTKAKDLCRRVSRGITTGATLLRSLLRLVEYRAYSPAIRLPPLQQVQLHVTLLCSHVYQEDVSLRNPSPYPDLTRDIHRRGWSGGNSLVLYLVSPRIESRLGHRLSSLRLFVVFLNPSRKIWEYYID
jgi:hypothetical protein